MRNTRLPAEVGDVVGFTLDERKLGGGVHDQLGTITQALGLLKNGASDANDARSYYFRVHLFQRETRLTLARSQFHIVRKHNSPKGDLL